MEYVKQSCDTVRLLLTHKRKAAEQLPGHTAAEATLPCTHFPPHAIVASPIALPAEGLKFYCDLGITTSIKKTILPKF